MSLTIFRLSNTEILQNSVKLGPTDTLKLILTATDNGSPKRPHQAFLLLRDWSTKLETSFTFSMKESGKGKLEIVRPRPGTKAPRLTEADAKGPSHTTIDRFTITTSCLDVGLLWTE